VPSAHRRCIPFCIPQPRKWGHKSPLGAALPSGNCRRDPMIPHESTWVLFGGNLNLARLPIPPRGLPAPGEFSSNESAPSFLLHAGRRLAERRRFAQASSSPNECCMAVFGGFLLGISARRPCDWNAEAPKSSPAGLGFAGNFNHSMQCGASITVPAHDRIAAEDW
jgi:hypothetical protein